MGAYQTFVHGSEQENITSNNARSIDDCSPRGLSLQRQARAANVRQLKVIETEESQPFAYHDKNGSVQSVDVGKKMVANLSLQDPDIYNGQPAFKNTDQNDMMADYRTKTGLVGGQLVKGHLLNEKLGGKADNSNLYPITDGANSDHLGYVENHVKKLILAGRTVEYEVSAGPYPGEPCSTIGCRNSRFVCHYKTTDSKGPSVDKSITIESNISRGVKRSRGSALDASSGEYLKEGDVVHENGLYGNWNKKLRKK